MSPDLLNRFLPKVVLPVVIALIVGVTIGAQPAAAATSPIKNPPPGQVTTDVLPTVQIDGVVWSQAVVGNKVYAGGNFANARPAGAPPGVNTSPRANLLSFDIQTGVMTNFAPSLNSQVLAVAVSPNGTRLYVGGSFTTVNGVTRNRIAAFDLVTGALVTSFAPSVNYTVSSIVATDTTVYFGGAFGFVNGVSRGRVAAVQATTGSLLPFVANADAGVQAMTLNPARTKLIVGGAFQNVNGIPAYGMVALNVATGAVLPWAATNVVRNAGANAAIMSLTADASKVYGTGYVFGLGGNLEGTFAADGTTGAIVWIEDCHGDTYENLPMNGVVYTVGHAHFCGNIGGFPETKPNYTTYGHGLAFTTNATGTVQKNSGGPSYFNFENQPSPSLTNWFPELAVGTFTGASQAAWSITGNTNYIVLGGEFPKVNGTAQQGLVRFAVKPIAPAKKGPKAVGAAFVPVLKQETTGVRVSWQSNYDNDDMTLTYKVVRDNNTTLPVNQFTADSTFWNRPTLTFLDTTVGSGQHKYRLYALDSAGNVAAGDNVTVTVAPTAAPAGAALFKGGRLAPSIGEAASVFTGTTATDVSAVDSAQPATQDQSATASQPAASSTSGSASPSAGAPAVDTAPEALDRTAASTLPSIAG